MLFNLLCRNGSVADILKTNLTIDQKLTLGVTAFYEFEIWGVLCRELYNLQL